MYSHDYIIRLIQQFVVFLARLAGLKKKDDPEVILISLEGAYQQFLGLSKETVASLSAEGVIDLFSATGEMDCNRIMVAAIILKEEARALEKLREPSAEHLYRKADVLLACARKNETKLEQELRKFLNDKSD